MFAVIKTGGKQYRVAKDDEITIERIAASAGDKVQFNDVLMVGAGADVTVGAPLIDDAGVQAEVVEQKRGDKVMTFKKRRRKHSSKRIKGHRQYLTTVKITDILAKGAAKSGVTAAIGTGSVEGPAPALSGAAPTPAPAAAADAAEGTRPSNLLDAAQGEADDLTKISGVGPKLNGLLNENGVFHFWQIAEWGPAEIAYMDDKLSFKGRIERDGWIDQAKQFAAEAKGDA